MGGDGVRIQAETSESRPESKELNRQNIERYIEGCEEIAVRLDTIIRNVAESGKRPVILIPSRGAVPIFILARRFLNELQAQGSYLADRNAKYYPEGIFNFQEFLSSLARVSSSALPRETSAVKGNSTTSTVV